MSLARGLDYYTGVIYEAVLKGKFFAPCAWIVVLVDGRRWDCFQLYQLWSDCLSWHLVSPKCVILWPCHHYMSSCFNPTCHILLTQCVTNLMCHLVSAYCVTLYNLMCHLVQYNVSPFINLMCHLVSLQYVIMYVPPYVNIVSSNAWYHVIVLICNISPWSGFLLSVCCWKCTRVY